MHSRQPPPYVTAYPTRAEQLLYFLANGMTLLGDMGFMRVAFQGEPGAYSEQAVFEIFPEVESVAAPVLRDVFDLLANNQVDFAVVPVENSQAGSINETYDLLLEHSGRLFVRGEHELRVRHCLLGLRGAQLSDIRSAYSHPQALAQTAKWLRDRDITPVTYYDTAGAAQRLAESGTASEAAVASARAAKVYDLRILAEGIEDNPTNRTRFLVIGRESLLPTDATGKTSLVFSTANKPGALYKALGALAERGINLTKLESRPSREDGWQYVFYVDCSGWATEAPLSDALADLRQVVGWCKVLGSYPAVV